MGRRIERVKERRRGGRSAETETEGEVVEVDRETEAGAEIREADDEIDGGTKAEAEAWTTAASRSRCNLRAGARNLVTTLQSEVANSCPLVPTTRCTLTNTQSGAFMSARQPQMMTMRQPELYTTESSEARENTRKVSITHRALRIRSAKAMSLHMLPSAVGIITIEL